RLDLVAEVSGKTQRMAGAVARMFAERRTHLAGLARGLPQPQDLIGAAQQRLDDRAERLALAIRARLDEMTPRLAQAMARTLKARRDALDNFAGRLATHSENHESLLRRGYAVVYADGRIATAAAEVRPGASLGVQFHDGKVDATVPGRRTRRAAPPTTQGQL